MRPYESAYWWRRAPIIGVLLLATALRVHGLTLQSLGSDEFLTILFGGQKAIPDVLFGYVRDFNPPGMVLFYHFVVLPVGDTEFLVRFPQALIGTLTVAVMYPLGRMLLSHWGGLFAAGLMAVLYTPIFYSQDARPYATMILLACLSSYLWVHLMRDMTASNGLFRRPRWALAYLACGVAMAYTHYFCLLLLGMQGLVAVLLWIRKPRAVLRLVLIYLAVLLCYIPWLPYMIALLAQSSYWPDPPGAFLPEVVGVIQSFLNGSLPLAVAALALIGWVLAAVFTRSPLTTAGWPGQHTIDFRGALPGWRTGLLLALWLFIPICVVYGVSKIRFSIWVLRYMLIGFPALCLLLAAGVMSLARNTRARIAATSIILVVLALDLAVRLEYYTQYATAQVRQAVMTIIERSQTLPGESAVAAISPIGHFQQDELNYYFTHLGSPLRAEINAGFESNSEPFYEYLEARKPDYVWLVKVEPVEEPEKAFLGELGRSATLVEQPKFPQVSIWLYQIEPPDTP